MELEILPTLFRWLHIGPVIISIGGAFFMRFILLPSTGESLPDPQRQQLRAAVMGRWRKVVHICIGLILVSGLFNVYHAIVVVGKPVMYHMLFGVKLLAALGVFFIASALVSRSEAFARMRADSRKWLGVLIGLAALIVILSGVMKNLPGKPATDLRPAAILLNDPAIGLA